MPIESKLRIALVSAYPPGQQSLNEYGYHLADHLARRDDVAEIVVLADKIAPGMAELRHPSGKVRVERVWQFNALSTLPRLLRAIRRAKVDGVLFNLQMATFGDREVPAALGLFAPMLARMGGTTSGVIAHNILGGVDLEQTVLAGRPLRQALVRWAGGIVNRALLRASYVTTTLQGYVDVLAPIAGKADLSLVPHGTFDTEERPWIAHAARPRRIVTMGKYGTYKRLETLLAAFDILRKDPALADVQLVIGGTDHPSVKGYVAGLARKRRGDKGVRFHGYVAEEDIPAFFESARLSVFDYQATTGSSGVLHQTAGYGAFPVFPKIGDFVDICRDEGIEGAHYTPGDAQDMARAMAAALKNTAGTEKVALANLTAARGMPFADVVDVHVRRIARKTNGSPVPATVQPVEATAYPKG